MQIKYFCLLLSLTYLLLANVSEEDNDENPWAGSLRHVKDKPRRGHKNDEKEDMHGGAPWMGTLRHVVHDNKVS